MGMPIPAVLMLVAMVVLMLMLMIMPVRMLVLFNVFGFHSSPASARSQFARNTHCIVRARYSNFQPKCLDKATIPHCKAASSPFSHPYH
jgi:hypothetical protein